MPDRSRKTKNIQLRWDVVRDTPPRGEAASHPLASARDECVTSPVTAVQPSRTSLAGRAAAPMLPRRAPGRGQLRPARRARCRHSAAAVALIPKLAATRRFDRPSALSRRTSRIFRIGNLSWGIPPPSLKGAQAMPISRITQRAAALVQVFTPPDAMVRVRWTPSTGMGGGRHVPESAAINRCAQGVLSREPMQTLNVSICSLWS
jgi:hypothetical protein